MRQVEFWLGRPGSGKTYGCLAQIAAELARCPRGAPLVLLVPEQATAQMERRLAAWPGVGAGFIRARVFSFDHLMHEAFARAGGQPARVVDEAGRVLLLRRALERQRAQLTVLGAAAGQSGVAEAVSRALLEFQRYGWSVQELEAWIDAQAAAAPPGDRRVRKLHDLALVWRDYEAALARLGWRDVAARVEAGIQAIRRWDELDGAQVWVDGFASFTRQELDLLEALMAHATQTVVALCADPVAAQGEPDSSRAGEERLFEPIEQTFRRLKARWTEAGWSVSIRPLPESGQPTRFAGSPALGHLEGRVLGQLWPEPLPDELWHAAAQPGAPPPVELIEADDMRAEVEAVARRIVAVCRPQVCGVDADPDRPPLAWREVAVLARDLEPYEALVREVFEQFAIPYFIDRPRRIDGHPLARLLITALRVAATGWAADAVRAYLKGGLAPLAEDEADLCERWAAAREPRTPEGWRAAPGEPARWMRPVERLEAALRRGEPPAGALWRLIEDAEAAAALERRVADARAEGREEEAALHEQAWNETIGWLEQLDALARDDPEGFVFRSQEDFALYADRLAGWVQAALGALRARLTPPTLDQVVIGAVDRSRTPDVRLAFVLGMNEKHFPRLWFSDPMIGDEERQQLAGSGRPLGPDSTERRRQEQFWAVIALTRASQRLVVSRPLLDAEGRAADPSPVFNLLAYGFPRAPRRRVGRSGRGDEESLPLRPEEWALRLSDAVEVWRALGRARPLAEWMAAGPPWACAGLDATTREALSRAACAAVPRAPAALDPSLAAAAIQSRPEVTVTALETYGRCPFQFFAQHLLRLETPTEADLAAWELGRWRHKALERLFVQFGGPEGLAWGQLDLSLADELIDRTVRDAGGDPALAERVAARPVDRLRLELAGRDLMLFVRVLRDAGSLGAFRQIATERPFGRESGLEVVLGDLRVGVSGKIDRIDRADGPDGCWLAVVDYKSGASEMELEQVLGGVSLQLPVYALAAREALAPADRGRARIGGLLYWSMTTAMADRMPRAAEAREDPIEGWQPSGLIDQDAAELFDRTVEPSGESRYYRFRRTKDGRLYRNSRGVCSRAQMDALLDAARNWLQEHVRRIAAGEIAARPFRGGKRMPCERCAFAAVCRLAEADSIRPRDFDRAALASWKALRAGGGADA